MPSSHLRQMGWSRMGRSHAFPFQTARLLYFHRDGGRHYVPIFWNYRRLSHATRTHLRLLGCTWGLSLLYFRVSLVVWLCHSSVGFLLDFHSWRKFCVLYTAVETRGGKIARLAQGGGTMFRVMLVVYKVVVLYCKTLHKRTRAILDGTVQLYLRYIKVKWREARRGGEQYVTISLALSVTCSDEDGFTRWCSSTRFFWKQGLSEREGNYLHSKARLLFLPNNVKDLPGQLISNDNKFIGVRFFVLCREVPRVSENSTQTICLQFFISIQVTSKAIAWNTSGGTSRWGTRATSVRGVYDFTFYYVFATSTRCGQYKCKESFFLWMSLSSENAQKNGPSFHRQFKGPYHA